MAKTRRNRSKRSKGRKEEKVEATFAGLNQWYKKIFEELGWMVLAKEKRYDDKVEVYKHGIQRFKEAAKNAKSELTEHDRKRDIDIMLDMIEILEKHVKKDFQ